MDLKYEHEKQKIIIFAVKYNLAKSGNNYKSKRPSWKKYR